MSLHCRNRNDVAAFMIDDVTVPVPEPASMALLAIGACLVMKRRRR